MLAAGKLSSPKRLSFMLWCGVAAAFMAPTEILSEQHFARIRSVDLAKVRMKTALLVSGLKALRKKRNS